MSHTEPGKVEKSDKYEHSDAQSRPVLVFLLAIAAICVFCFIGARVLIGLFEGTTTSSRRTASPMAERELPEVARLQADPSRELAEFRAREKDETNVYHWPNADAEEARIPLHRALLIVAERGLPVRSRTATTTRTSTRTAPEVPE